MKRALLAVALIGAAAVVPGVGHATTLNVGTCSVTADVTWDTAVTAIPASNGFTFSGPIQCSGAIGDDAGNAAQSLIGGEITGQGASSTGCLLGTGTAGFEAAFTTGQDDQGRELRDLWSGELSDAHSGVAGAVLVTLQRIDHQVQVTDPDTGEQSWQTTSAETVGANAAGGILTFSVDDPTTCAGAGFTSATVNGTIAYAFQADPETEG